MTTPAKPALLNAAQAYLARWQAYLVANPGLDERTIQEAMSRGDPPPDPIAKPDETAVTTWAESYPVAHRVYWTIRAALQETDGSPRPHHHRIAVLAIHDAFPSKPERARLGLPATVKELAALLGVTDRVLRKYKVNYAPIFSTTQKTLATTFLNEFYGQALEAMGKTAVIIGREGNPDRNLLFRMKGDLGPHGGETDPLHTVGLTLDEWKAEQEQRRLGAEAETAETLDIFEEEDGNE